MDAYEAELDDELSSELELDGQSFMSWPGAMLDAAVPGSLAWPGGRLLDLPGARSLAFVGHSIELDELISELDEEDVPWAKDGPRKAMDAAPMITAAAAPPILICMLKSPNDKDPRRTTCDRGIWFRLHATPCL